MPGEEGGQNDRVLARLAAEVEHLPDEVAGVEVERWERSASGARAMAVVRAWRADRLVGIDPADFDATGNSRYKIVAFYAPN